MENKVNEKGFELPTEAPNIISDNSEGNEFNLYAFLEDCNGVLIDFFRGAW